MTDATPARDQFDAIIAAFGKFTGDLRLAKRDVLAGAFLEVLANDGWTLARADEVERLREALAMSADALDIWVSHRPGDDGCPHTPGRICPSHSVVREARALAAPEPAAKGGWEKGTVTLADHQDDSYGQCVVCRVYVPHTDDVFLTEPFPCPTLRLRATEAEAEGLRAWLDSIRDLCLSALDVPIAPSDERLHRMIVAQVNTALAAQPAYPTAWAYEQACRALDGHRARADAAEAEVAGLRRLVERTAAMGYCSQTGHEHLMRDAQVALTTALAAQPAAPEAVR